MSQRLMSQRRGSQRGGEIESLIKESEARMREAKKLRARTNIIASEVAVGLEGLARPGTDEYEKTQLRIKELKKVVGNNAQLDNEATAIGAAMRSVAGEFKKYREEEEAAKQARAAREDELCASVLNSQEEGLNLTQLSQVKKAAEEEGGPAKTAKDYKPPGLSILQDVPQDALSEEDLMRNEAVRKFIRDVSLVHDPKARMPWEGPASDASDDEMEITQMNVAPERRFMCPIMKSTMVNPRRNSHCGHYYGKDAIENHIAIKKRDGEQPICPVMGCSKTVSARSLQEDISFEAELQKFQDEAEEMEE